MASNYYSKFSRSRNLVNLAIGSQNNSTQSEELGYENEEYVNIEPSSPLPFGASEILDNCSLSLLKEICFEDDPSREENQSYTFENSTLVLSDKIVASNSEQDQPIIYTHEEEINSNLLSTPNITQEKHTDNESQASFLLNVTNNLLGDNITDSSIDQFTQNKDNIDYNDTRDVNTPMPSSDYDFVEEDQPVPSVRSLLTDPTASSPVSQYYSSGDTLTPLTCRKRKFTKKKDSGRLREKFCHEWIDSKRKRLKNTGEAYNSRNGKIRDKKNICGPCQSTCKLKCFEKFEEETRCAIFNKFWAVGNHSQQYNFIVNYVVRINKKRTITQGQSRRSYTYIYHLPVNQNNQTTKLVVCKSMFLNTISCGPKMIRTAMSKFANTSSLALVDNRGRHSHHKTSINEEMIKSVLDHVNSFEPVDSHYCRKDSNKVYLDGSLNFVQMYNLYKEWYDAAKYGTKCESLRQYRDIVNKHINLSFHHPKKDQCPVCHSYKNGPVTSEGKINFDNHMKNKNLTRSLKEKDKRDSQNNAKIFCATFDLQKVLLSPSDAVESHVKIVNPPTSRSRIGPRTAAASAREPQPHRPVSRSRLGPRAAAVSTHKPQPFRPMSGRLIDP
ncbi:hypothetical protein ACJJTC_009592 [Scirpophaga incertulas]